MLSIIKLIIIVFAISYVICSLIAVFSFLKDIRDFKQEIQFTGSREQLIEYMLFGEKSVESEAVENVSESE